ncbi:sulfotransferase [uncultured Nitrospira sp.]|uniref:sulfotransferase n=1 Tax=uncultured Nitrospira sp. TaxID=157176 RepID=UPI003140B086
MANLNRYNGIERLLHHLAFDYPFIQKILCDLETDLFSASLKKKTVTKPVFVTGLPRAGTTLLLETIYNTGEFATFTYRQMPFILTPLLWNRISSRFQRLGNTLERAHGDGVLISFDSPEAFEEVIWLGSLKDKIVGKNTLHPVLPTDLTEEFRESFRHIIKKLLVLQDSTHQGEHSRYLSKNNANVSRLKAITSIFPDAIILVPFRHPLTHVKSLMNQHQRFSAEHSTDAFSKKYMEWIGHYEFGANIRPIDFDGQITQTLRFNFEDPNFWLAYWSKAYQHCLVEASANMVFIDFDFLLQEGEHVLRKIGKTIDISNIETLTEHAATFRNPKSSSIEIGDLLPEVWKEAQMVHEQLCQRRL